MQPFLYYWAPVLAWCAAIFSESSFRVPSVVPDWRYLDKIAHAAIYSVLSILLCRALRSMPGRKMRSSGLILLILIATLLTALYGVTDEWHQSFVAGRTADGYDLLADLAGGLVGGIIYALYDGRRPKLKSTAL